MRTKQKAVRRRKGFVSVYVAFSSFLLIPMAGLAIDFAFSIASRQSCRRRWMRLLLVPGSTLNRGSVMDTTAVNDVALRFFTANYPAGYFGSTPVTYNSTPVQGALGVRTITSQRQSTRPDAIYARARHQPKHGGRHRAGHGPLCQHDAGCGSLGIGLPGDI